MFSILSHFSYILQWKLLRVYQSVSYSNGVKSWDGHDGPIRLQLKPIVEVWLSGNMPEPRPAVLELQSFLICDSSNFSLLFTPWICTGNLLHSRRQLHFLRDSRGLRTVYRASAVCNCSCCVHRQSRWFWLFGWYNCIGEIKDVC